MPVSFRKKQKIKLKLAVLFHQINCKIRYNFNIVFRVANVYLGTNKQWCHVIAIVQLF